MDFRVLLSIIGFIQRKDYVHNDQEKWRGLYMTFITFIGGLAEKCGKLAIGDELLSINGESVLNKPLSEAIKLLQQSGQRIQLQMCRKATGEFPKYSRTSFREMLRLGKGMWGKQICVFYGYFSF